MKEFLDDCRCGVTEKDHDEGSPMLELDGIDDGLWRVICHGCGMNTGPHHDISIAVATWNRK